MKVTIVGAGMGGLAAASLLAQAGHHEVLVLEQSAGFREAGYGIGLYPLGAMVFNALGLGHALRERAVELNQYEVHGPDGTCLQSVDLGALLSNYGPMLGVTRSDLIDLLVSSLPVGTIQFGARATHARLDGDHVVLTTEDGSQFRSDIVVAADGMYSQLRSCLFDQVAVHDTAFHAWMWWAPFALAKPQTVAEYWGPSAFVGLYPMPKFVNVAVGVPKELSPDPLGDADEIMRTLREVVTEHAPAVAQMPHLWELEGAKPFLWPMTDVRAPALTALDDRLALLGDAGVGFLPTAGVGASNALRSGAALAYELSLADANSAQAALRRWDRRVRPLVQGNQADSRQLAKLMMVRHKSASALVTLLLKHMPVTTITNSIIKSMEEPF